MSPHRTSFFHRTAGSLLLILGLGLTALAQQQQPPKPPPGFGPPTPEQQAATEADHKNMMEQLGIKALAAGAERQRAGAEPRELRRGARPTRSRICPDVLTLKNGKKVTTAEQWWQQRRPEIVEDFEREVIGRVPKNVPKVTWTVDRDTPTATVGGHPRRRQAAHRPRRQLRRIPTITVDIQMTLVTAGGREGAGAGDDHVRLAATCAGDRRGAAAALRPAASAGPADPPATEQLIADGWGYAFAEPGQHPGRQRRRPHEGHHRPRQQGAAAQAGRLGRAARVGLGRGARARLSRDRSRRSTRSTSASKASRATARPRS